MCAISVVVYCSYAIYNRFPSFVLLLLIINIAIIYMESNG